MDLSLDEDQEALRALAADLFTKRAPAGRVEEVEAGAERFDRALWAELGKAGLLGIALPADVGGDGLGLLAAALVCAEHGRSVAPVPLAWTLAAAAAVDAFGSADQRAGLLPRLAAGTAVATVAVPGTAAGVTVSPGVSSAGGLAAGPVGSAVGSAGGSLSGTIIAVPYGHVADAVVVPVGEELYLLDPRGAGVVVQPGVATSREIHAELLLDGAPAELLGSAPTAGPAGSTVLAGSVSGGGSASPNASAAVGGTACPGGPAAWLEARLLVLLAATQAGVTAAALRIAADYTSGREQFGKPLSAFQGVALKAADAYVDVAGIESTALQAAWRLDLGEDATADVLTAAWWAAEAGQHCVHITQHLHGGMGADITYPVHRYFLWGKQLELLVGGASALLTRLGDALVTLPNPGDAM